MSFGSIRTDETGPTRCFCKAGRRRTPSNTVAPAAVALRPRRDCSIREPGDVRWPQTSAWLLMLLELIGITGCSAVLYLDVRAIYMFGAAAPAARSCSSSY
jgi:hypothetical protein